VNITFAGHEAFDSFYAWTINDKKIAKKIADLIKDIQRNPYGGLGKPEPLKHEFSGYYSRHITEEHRLVYKIEGDTIIINSCKGHYGG
jgi:toxin YoeB